MQPQSDSNSGWMAYQHLPQSETSTPLPSAQLESDQTLHRLEANVFYSPSTMFAMAPLPPLNIFELADADKPRIGFRVVASGGVDWVRNTLESPNPQADATSQTLLAHLAWESSPFVSLWKSWTRAVNWAKDRQRLGAKKVDIVAVWIHDHVVYDAHKAAITLPLPKEKRHDWYKDEVTILGLGGEDDSNILACFYRVTERQWETVTFDLDGRLLTASLPIGLLEVKVSSDEEEDEREDARRWQKGGLAALREEVFSSTRSYDNSIVYVLAELLCEKLPGRAPVVTSRPGRRNIASKDLLALRARTRAERHLPGGRGVLV